MLRQLSILTKHTRQPAQTYMCNPTLGNWEVWLEFCQDWHKQEILKNIDLAKLKSGAMLLFFKNFHMINLFKLKAFQKKEIRSSKEKFVIHCQDSQQVVGWVPEGTNHGPHSSTHNPTVAV